jgi:hypothetical protein
MANLTAASPGGWQSPSAATPFLRSGCRLSLNTRSTNKMPSANAEGETAGQSPIALEYAEEYSRIRQRTAFAAAVARRSGP